MKRWSGGTLILILALLLFLRYSSLLSSTTTPSVATSSPTPPYYPIHKVEAHILASLPGLTSLFHATSPSSSSSSHLLTWRHLRDLVSRSDALPHTAAAVLEASVAFSDLLDESTNATSAPTSSNTGCPFAVNVSSSNELEIPCGFIENSAVTVVGIAGGGGNGTAHFAIELLGRNIDASGGPPVVIRVNVSFGEESRWFIAQNSRLPELGWGLWEHCPDPDGNLEVDGLVRCNLQSGESVIQKKLNVSTPPPVEPPKKRSRTSMGSPFVEGKPFVATLWAGLEGFHLTVNGQHETSFTYRERLEPWTVSRVRVEGNLDLLSLVANGLPVSEDLEFADIDKLKAPLPKKRIQILVGVFSTGNNFERRMAIRRSWMQFEAVRTGEVAVRFFTGLDKNKQVNLALWKEAEMYGDIQLMPFVDYYSLITLKTIATCIFGTKILHAKFIMKTDDDAFVRIDEVMSILQRGAPQGLYYGLITFESSPHRDEDSKWFIRPEEWSHDAYPPWAHGPGYIISRDIAKFVVHGHQEMKLPLFKLEDVAMGIWIQEFRKSGHEVTYVNDDRFHCDGCQSDYVLAHYQGPRLLLCLWEMLQKEHNPVCCE